MKFLKSIFLLLISAKLTAQCPPHLSVYTQIFSYTLTCNNPTLLASGTSTTFNTEISWKVPSTPSLINSPTVILGPPNGPPTSTSSLMYADYTVVATNTALACSFDTVIRIYQNFHPPSITPTILANPSNTLCQKNITLTYTVPPYIENGFMPSYFYKWNEPNPQPNYPNQWSYIAKNAGVYSLTIVNGYGNYNGCFKTYTINITDSRPQFGLAGTAPTSSNTCDGSLIVTTQIPPGGYSLSTTSGSLNGTTLSNLCYGWVKVCMTFTDTQCFKCDSLLMNAATSLDEIDLVKEISVFPNPGKDVVQVIYPVNTIGNLSLYTLGGAEILRKELEANGMFIIRDLAEGIYLLRMELNGQCLRKKLIIIK